MNEKYQIEIDEFKERFENYKGARIVLYGIGRYTATLLDGLKDTEFRFVGLMDKDPDNLGKVILGVPVIDRHTAEQSADMVVINTSETYWSVIYNRIKDIKLDPRSRSKYQRPKWFRSISLTRCLCGAYAIRRTSFA